MIYSAIVVCEIAFWAFLAAGLAIRYLLKRRRLSTIVLMGSPAVDAILLGLVAQDLHQGGSPDQSHALAATYLGISVAFGPSVVGWADKRFARWVTGTRRETTVGRSPSDHLNEEWRLFSRALLAWTISSTLLLALSAIVGNFDDARPLLGFIGVFTMALAVWFVVGPLRGMIALASSRERDTPPSRVEPARTRLQVENRPMLAAVKNRATTLSAGQWAPWWIYAAVVLPANYLRMAAMPYGTVPEWAVVVVVLGMSALLLIVTTAVYRVLAQR